MSHYHIENIKTKIKLPLLILNIITEVQVIIKFLEMRRKEKL